MYLCRQIKTESFMGVQTLYIIIYMECPFIDKDLSDTNISKAINSK